MPISISKATATEYAFILGKIPSEDSMHAVDELRLNIHTINLPGVSLENTQFNWQGKNVQYHIGGITFEPISISFTVDVEFANWKVLSNWLMYIADNKENTGALSICSSTKT